jgi:hypothetical protein
LIPGIPARCGRRPSEVIIQEVGPQ